mgnify:CR=1 FL=1
MTLPNSGSLSFTQIANEFGNRGSIGNYRVNQNIGGVNWPLDEGFPTSGSVSFSTFRGKRRNIVVDCYSSGGSRVNAARRGRTTVGGGPTSPRSSRVIIYVNNTFTSDSIQTRTRCALRTGTYGNSENGNTPSKVDIIMGNATRIYGGGGNGGNGGNAGEGNANGGNNGNPGTSALGLQTSVEEIVLSGSSVIRAGSGGGGGGGGAGGELNNSEEYGGGGGGAGGSGSPAGVSGTKGNSAGEVDDYGNNGNGGTLTGGGSGGEGATGGEEENNADGGGGGGGGSWGQNAEANGGEAGQGEGFSAGEARDGNPGGYPSQQNSGGEFTQSPVANGTGGGGGRGGARGSGQSQGSGGTGGDTGYSICSNGGISINVSGGTRQGPTGTGQGVS